MGKRIGNLNLVNYKDHPQNEMYKILNFNSEAEADMFKSMLDEKNIWYEEEVEMHEGEPLYLFAVKNRQFNEVQKVNFRVNAKFRKPLVENKYGQYALVIFLFIVLGIAIIGYVKANY